MSRVEVPSTRAGDGDSIFGEMVGGARGRGRRPEPEVVVKEVEVIREVEVVKEVLVDSIPSVEDVPDRTRPDSDTKQLTDTETADLAACEKAITAAQEGARRAFWVIGKALQTVQDGRLYRREYETFDEYVRSRWDMSGRQAYRLIESWQLAELVRPIGHTAPTESHIRELLPAAKVHGDEAAVQIWEKAQEEDKVTAAVIAALRDQLGYGKPSQGDATTGESAGEAVARRMGAISRVLGRKVSRGELSRHLLDVLVEDDRLFEQVVSRMRPNGDA